VLAEPGLARRLGEAIGQALAEQHGRIGAEDLRGWLPKRVGWPMPRAWIDARLPQVTTDATLTARIGRALDRYRGQTVKAADRVLVHGDLGLHNMAFDPVNDGLAGIFDYDGAAFADRHHDFRYLVFEGGHAAMLDGALAVYEAATGVRLDRDRIRLYHAACAICFLAFRAGHAPEEPWCGRTLAEDLAWTDGALAAIGL
jgi:Ser/Thr protein kinase RdoA (MazF antagonist)